MRRVLLVWLLVVACATLAEQPRAPLVALHEIAPEIESDLRYAGRENFVGAPVDGYERPTCLLTEPAARALARVALALRERGLGLRVYDCYRPTRAVAHFMRWAAAPDDGATRASYHPFVPKAELVARGYIAETSSHSRGSTVDVTLVELATADAASRPLDMGTPFDFFDPRSHTASREVSAQARSNRRVLVQAMEAGGFANYPKEWWHFTLRDEPYPDTAFDVPVR